MSESQLTPCFVPLERLAVIDPESLQATTSPNFDFKYIDISSAAEGRLTVPSASIEFADAPSRARRVLRSGDVIMSTVRPNLKAFAYCSFDAGAFIGSTGFAVLRARENADPYFLLYSLLSDNVARQIDRLAVGSNYPAINSSDVRRLLIPKFSLGDQQRIAAILTSLDTAIEKTEALIEKHQKIKAGLMHDLFTRGVLPNGQLRPPREQAPEVYRGSLLGWVPNEWSLRALDQVAEVSRGKFTHRPRNDPPYLGGPFPFIQTGDVSAAAGARICEYSQTLSPLGAQVSSCFPAGTIAVTIAANIGDTAILAIPMYFPDSVVGVVVDQTVDARFIELSIRRAKPRLSANAQQSAQKNINLTDLRPLRIPIAPLAEQLRISARYDAAQAPIEKNENLLEKLRAQKLGLMQDLLTGKVPVKVADPEAVPA